MGDLKTMHIDIPVKTEGLSDTQVSQSRNQHGDNSIEMREDRLLRHILKEVVLEVRRNH